jgi:hypothetical protein
VKEAGVSFDIRDADTEVLVRQLASKLGVSLIEAIRTAVRNDLARLDAAAARSEIAASPGHAGSSTEPAPTDKDAFTELNDDG